MRAGRFSRSMILVVLIGCTTAPGCAVMDAPLESDIGQIAAEEEKAETAPDPDLPAFFVEIRPEGKERERYRLPLTEQATYVNDVLKKSGVAGRFGRVRIQVWRPMQHGEGYHKLKVPFDRKARNAAREYDYAIRPKDLVVFIEDTSTIVDDMLGSVSDALGQFTP